MSSSFDLIVLGGGPGGYVAAERAGAAGLKTLLVEQRHLGGVCLNEGCIPSKTLLNSAKVYAHAAHGAAYGVRAENVVFDFPAVMARKQKVIETLRGGIAGLMKKNGVTVVNARGRLLPGGRVQAGDAIHAAANILVATGSAPARPPIPGLDLPGVLDSTGILQLERLPKGLTVIGGGIIGCEFACFFATVGVPVTVIEMLPEICPTLDADAARLLRDELTKLGVTFHLGARVAEITPADVAFSVNGAPQRLARDTVLVATGRSVNTGDLGLEDVRMDFDRRGIKTDERGATNIPGVWACGDVTGRGWLAHTASRQGEVVITNLLGKRDRMRWNAIPSVVYTTPEVAAVGLTEADARAAGRDIATAKFPMHANGRFLAEHAAGARGLAKVVVEKGTRRLLGVHLVGAAASEMIWGAAAALEMEMRADELREIVFPHPTASEALRDALFHLPK